MEKLVLSILVYFPIFHYAAKVYVPSSKILTSILRAVFSFIWQKKTELVSRDTLCMRFL